MELSIIIVNYNAAPFLSRCVESIEAFIAGAPHEVCLVDNASTDGSLTLVRNRFPRVRLIANDRNLGFAAAINQGLRATHGRYVLWLNPDSELLDGGLPELVRYLDRNTAVGIVGPQILDWDGAVQLSCRSFPSYGTALFHRHSLLTRWFPANRYSRRYLHTGWDHGQVREVDWVSGACLLHRRQLVREIGPADERFFMYCEDVDFCLRARRRNWAVHYHPGARVRHCIGGSSRLAATRTSIERHRSMWRYYAKHFGRSPVKDAVVGAAIWGRCGWALAAAGLRRGIARRGGIERPGGSGVLKPPLYISAKG